MLSHQTPAVTPQMIRAALDWIQTENAYSHCLLVEVGEYEIEQILKAVFSGKVVFLEGGEVKK